ncbi:unnamed protein product [Effrenium voratum]|uniref:Uncharacterized protein n=1 Tax=Effrenium voratum TaxID=2562239 RepID=A0AA36I6Y0_9DINO|nr:unnamed protein product [Effrenium voratum]
MSRQEAALCWSAMVRRTGGEAVALAFPFTCGYVGRHKRWSTLVMEIEESLVDEWGSLGILVMRDTFCNFLDSPELFCESPGMAEATPLGRRSRNPAAPVWLRPEERLRLDLRKSQEAQRAAEAESRRLQDQNEELRAALDEADRDAREAEALNGHMQRRVDEMEVQLAALRQYESEFDQKVTKMLDERDEALASAAKDKEAILLKVRELQEELALARKSPAAEGLADASELAMMLKERQLEVEDLLDRTEQLEEDLARAREELDLRPGLKPSVPGDASLTAGLQPAQQQQQYEERLRHLKADALEKDARLLDAEKKLEQLARGMGAEAILAENRQVAKENADMKRQVAEAKRDLSHYLSEAASIVYENELLRNIANVKPEQLKLQDWKLKDKVTSAKAQAVARQLEKDLAELETERGKLKARLRQMAELAAEKVSLLHDLQPEEMLQLEEIAARMRQGKLELPLDDQSSRLKEERDELKRRLAMKDREVAEHVDRKVEEVLKKQGTTKDLEAKLAAQSSAQVGL